MKREMVPFHRSISIWICCGFAFLFCACPLSLQAPPPSVFKPPPGILGRLKTKTAEFFKKNPERISERHPISPKEKLAKFYVYRERAQQLSKRYQTDKAFRMRFNQTQQKLIEQGIDAALFSFIPQHSALFERSSIRFIANQLGESQADEGIDDSMSLRIKNVAKSVLLDAVREVRPFDFPTQSDFKVALREAVEKVCNQLNRMTPPLAWNLKLVSSEDSDKLVFESRDSTLLGVEISIGAVLDRLTVCEDFEEL